jgi:hypothetical protein
MSETNLSASSYKRTGDVIEAEVGGEVVLLHTQNWQYFEFDPVGAAIWGLLKEPRNLDSLVIALTDRFDVDRARCASETRAFLEEMVEQGLVVAGND